MIEAHPSGPIYFHASFITLITLPDYRLHREVSLYEGQRIGALTICPPTLSTEVEFLKSNFGTRLVIHFFEPDVRDAEPAHDVVSMRNLATQSRIFISFCPWSADTEESQLQFQWRRRLDRPIISPRGIFNLRLFCSRGKDRLP